jgi:predicted nucleotidyltransferase
VGKGWAECGETIRGWVERACGALGSELGGSHVGTYLHGSLASGSFHPPKSDVDVLFVAGAPLTPEARRRFARTAVTVTRERPIVGGLECSVVLRDDLQRGVHPMPFEAHFGEEHVQEILEDRVDWDDTRTDGDLAAHVQAICEFGIALAGPPVGSIFRPPSHSDFLDSIRSDSDWIVQDEHILESPFYGVLNLARVFWVLDGVSTRLVPSKDEAGEWLLAEVPEEHRAILHMALDTYRDESPLRPEDRRSGGRSWPRGALLRFRDWARERLARAEEGGRE